MPEVRDLVSLLKSRTPIVVIETREEQRATHLLARVSEKLELPLYAWNIAEGMSRVGFGEQNTGNRAPDEVLRHIWNLKLAGLYLLLDFHPYLGDPLHVRLIKQVCMHAERYQQTLLFISHAITLPPELEHFAARFELQLPDEKALSQIIKQVASQWVQEHQQQFRADPEALRMLVKNLQGLPATEAARLARGAIYNDGAITLEDVPAVAEAKYHLLNQDSVLSYEYDLAHLSDVGGLETFKSWLHRRSTLFKGGDLAPTLEPPKGILLLGVQGGGKSLAAKAVAGTWGVPLLRLDFGTLYDKYFGETERKTREALKMAETMAPCVLWMDEIEKGVSTSESEQGTSRRLLGTLLTWMAEKKAPVFIVATANDIQALPPELMRKGRMDEVFFVDLPDRKIRKTIFEIHLQKRDLDPNAFDLDALADASEGFSGSEIEQAVVSSLYSVMHAPHRLSTPLLMQELASTRPLSILMAEKINHLRHWAQDRTVPAH